MFQRILVPLDGSERAERALPCGVRLARLTKATVHLVRVDDFLSAGAWAGMPAYPPPDVYRTETAQAAAYLDALHERLVEQGVNVRHDLLTGSAATSLLDYERDAGIDLLVVCSHGRDGIARFALGSVAYRLLRHGTAPVLLVHGFGEPLALDHVLIPLDGSARAEATLAVVQSLAGDVVHEVTLLRAITEPVEQPEADRYLAEIENRLAPEQLVCRRQVVYGEPAQAIIDAAGKTTLVAMATHGRSGLTRWALGSVADRVTHGGVAGTLLLRTGMLPSGPSA